MQRGLTAHACPEPPPVLAATPPQVLSEHIDAAEFGGGGPWAPLPSPTDATAATAFPSPPGGGWRGGPVGGDGGGREGRGENATARRLRAVAAHHFRLARRDLARLGGFVTRTLCSFRALRYGLGTAVFGALLPVELVSQVRFPR